MVNGARLVWFLLWGMETELNKNVPCEPLAIAAVECGISLSEI